jgi:adenylate cyclase
MISRGRNRRDWRVILWLSLGSLLTSAYFGYAIGEEDVPGWRSALSGMANSLVIATPILLFEVKGQQLGLVRRLRRLPLAWYFLFRVVFYSVVIVGGLIVTRVAVGTHGFSFDAQFLDSLVFALSMSTIVNLVFQIGLLLGFRTLSNLVTGRYTRPRAEQRVFLLIDMKNSTGLAERLGPIRFHALLNDFFRDVADAALECGAEIHKYVGDEAILTWSKEKALADGICLACPFAVRDRIVANAAQYRRRFDALPQFSAALHGGEIVAGEIGDVRREIAYVGDTLNVAARLLEACKTLGRDVLTSAELLQRARLPHQVQVEPLPTLSIRGRDAPLEIAALSMRGVPYQG